MSGIWKEKPDKIPPPNPVDPCLLQRAKPEAECRHYVSGRCYSPFAIPRRVVAGAQGTAKILNGAGDKSGCPVAVTATGLFL